MPRRLGKKDRINLYNFGVTFIRDARMNVQSALSLSLTLSLTQSKTLSVQSALQIRCVNNQKGPKVIMRKPRTCPQNWSVPLIGVPWPLYCTKMNKTWAENKPSGHSMHSCPHTGHPPPIMGVTSPNGYPHTSWSPHGGSVQDWTPLLTEQIAMPPLHKYIIII